jgi:hypothetical protein
MADSPVFRGRQFIAALLCQKERAPSRPTVDALHLLLNRPKGAWFTRPWNP